MNVTFDKEAEQFSVVAVPEIFFSEAMSFPPPFPWK